MEHNHICKVKFAGYLNLINILRISKKCIVFEHFAIKSFLTNFQIKEQSIYGLTFAVEAVPFNVVDMTFDVDSTDNKALNIADIWQLPNLKEKAHRQRLVDVITHAVDNGYI